MKILATFNLQFYNEGGTIPDLQRVVNLARFDAPRYT